MSEESPSVSQPFFIRVSRVPIPHQTRSFCFLLGHQTVEGPSAVHIIHPHSQPSPWPPPSHDSAPLASAARAHHNAVARDLSRAGDLDLALAAELDLEFGLAGFVMGQ